MCLHPMPVPPVPEETARIVRAAFPTGTPYGRMRDALGSVFTDADFAALFAVQGQPAEAPWRLALVTIFQYAEGPSDRQAADAVRGHLDWKYALSLPVTDPGFDHSVLSEFRTRLLVGGAERLLLETMPEQFQAHHLLKERGRQRTDSTHILAAVRRLSRLELVGETMRHALDVLAQAAPAWLAGQLQPPWEERYGTRVSSFRLPRGSAARLALALAIGADGFALLEALLAPSTPLWLRAIPAVEILRQVWVQNYAREGDGVQWRTEADLPPAALAIRSPHDPQARLGQKRDLLWLGYKVHLTETCDPDRPHLITGVEASAAPVPDSALTGVIQATLAEHGRLPREHLLDGGYVDADVLVASQEAYGVRVVGPVSADTSWQARAGEGYAASAFAIDWARETVTCPRGQSSVSWRPTQDAYGTQIIEVKFARAACRACPVQARRTRTAEGRRSLTLRPQKQHAALAAARQHQETAAFAQAYRLRAGMEGTLGQGVTAFELRRAHYVGELKTHLQHTLIAAAMNFTRVAAWLAGRPREKPRQSTWVRLLCQSACT